MLLQDNHPISYFSKKLCPRMQKASTYIHELFAITSAIAKWRHYLLGAKFFIYTDQQSLKNLMQQVIQTPEQQYYLTKLLGYNYEILYKPGKSNAAADALSRRPDFQQPSSSLMALSTPKLLIFEDIKREQAEASELQILMDSILPTEWAKADGIYFYKGKIYIPNHSTLKLLIVEEFHNSPVGGHGGIHKTFVQTSTNFFGHNMRKDVADFVKSCITCQQVKAINTSPYGLLQPLEIPKNVWEEVSLDFITHLPNSHGFTVILVIVDRFSKSASVLYSHIIQPLKLLNYSWILGESYMGFQSQL